MEYFQNTFSCHLCKQNGKYKAYVTLRTDGKKELLDIIDTKKAYLIFKNDCAFEERTVTFPPLVAFVSLL